MDAIVLCLSEQHDRRLLLAALAICIVGVYASFTLARHAGRAQGRTRGAWAGVSIVAAGCTAWATHMVALLAYRPGLPAAFDVLTTIQSLVLVIAGIGLSMSLVVGRRDRRRRVFAGVLLGLSVALLHYVGQAGYRISGTFRWDLSLAAGTASLGITLFAVALVASGERRPARRRLAAPLLLAGIGVLHTGGMAAMTPVYDPRIGFPAWSVAPGTIAPVVAGICLGLIGLAVLGLRFSLQAQAQVRRDRARLLDVSNLAVEGLAVCDDATILVANDSFARLIGAAKGDVIGCPIADFVPGISLHDLPEREEHEADLVALDGKRVPVRVLRSAVSVGRRRQAVFAFRDQRARLKSEATIRRLAYTDALTGLVNRARFADLLQARASQSATGASDLALLAIDLDRFKWVNDTFGAATGDDVLRGVADRLRGCGGKEDVVARLGGNEFAILASGPRDKATDLAARILDVLQRPFEMRGRTLEISASIGLAYLEGDAADAGTLPRNADLALESAKQSGGGQACIFEPHLLEDALRRSDLERDLRQAIERSELEVFYQPLVDALSGAFVGAEALARWNHAEQGMISPGLFIPLAEEVGLIGAIGEQVLEMACAEAARWPAHTSIAVNLSPVQLGDPNLVRKVTRVLAVTGLSAERLELEVTETALLGDDARTYRNLHQLRRLGIRIALDDFGTGYSSLSHLRRFPFDKIKIDQSFVRQIPHDAGSMAIVRAITALAADLRMRVTIEGVETAAQQAFAQREGCHHIQGYLISRPVPCEEMRAFMGSSDQLTLSA
ncbi:EAL domain-containing protein [uncultured Jannaschia sp.]|uniref:putative bifunctional diguanylate cyclase/phosphodiesterase n=1 Tax=uncultured Jannaschia sp. TaxID=293347 RepID=UPI0026064899|nr:EAL domain-containing protein [uncultured Jannaschia sp.]